jgi:hypothetical protein
MANNENILRRPWRMKPRGCEITNINILNFILLYFLGLLDIENYCRYVISFTFQPKLI